MGPLAAAAPLALLLALVPAAAALGQTLVADLSRRHVAIDTGFTGADVLLFGAVDGKGDIVVTISGPPETATVRRKRRIAGVWANADSVAFEGAPNFHAVAASRPLAEIGSPEMRANRGIGVGNLRFLPAPAHRHRPEAELAAFRAALIRNKQAEGLYSREPAEVAVIEDRLFRATVRFPANMATGEYTATVYLFREDGAVQAVATPMVVEKTGFGAEVYAFAHDRSPLYGIAAIVVAVAAGWLAGVVFRNV